MTADFQLQFTRLVELHLGAARLAALQWADDVAAAEDLVQDAFIALYETFSGDDSSSDAGNATMPERPMAWLCHVMRNRAIDVCRKRSRQRVRERRFAEERVWFTVDETVGTVGTTVHEIVAPEEIVAMLQSLEPGWREIVVLKIWGELTFEEIASLTAKPRSTVHRHWLEALARLREMIQ